MSDDQSRPADSTVAKPRMRWFRVRLRTLLVICTLTALVFGWRRHLLQERNDAINAIVTNGGKVEYEYDFFRRAAPDRMFPWMWCRHQLGLAGPIATLVKGSRVDSDFIARNVIPLQSLERLWLEDVAVTDEKLRQLCRLKNIKYVYWRSPGNARAFNVIDELTGIEVVDMPLDDVFLYIWDLHKIPIAIDEAELAPDILDAPTTAHLDGIPLHEALDRLLSPNGLGWTVGNGGIVIMSKESAQLVNHQAAVGQLRALLPNLKEIQIDCDVDRATSLTPVVTTHRHRTTAPSVGNP